MDWLWHLRGSVALSSYEREAVFDRLETLLRRQYKRKIVQDHNEVTFDTPLLTNFVSPNWLAMVIYDRGRFWIDCSANEPVLRYDLRSLHGFIFCLFGSAMFCAVGWQTGGFVTGVGLASVAFGWLYGMNILLSLARVPRLIRRTIRR